MAVLLFFGDSTVQGVGDPKGGWVDRFKAEVSEKMYGHNGIGEEYRIFNLGIGGGGTELLMKRFEVELEARIRPNESNVVVISVGTNDSRATGQPDNFICTTDEYKQRLSLMIDKAQTHGAKVLLIGTNPIDDSKTQPRPTGSYFNLKRVEMFNKAMAEVALDKKIHHIPIFELMLVSEWYSMIFADGLHLNDKGHAWVLDQVKPALEEVMK